MWRVQPNLYLGTHIDASDRAMLIGQGITHVLNCAVELPCYFPEAFSYLHLPLKDPDPSLTRTIPEACAFLDNALKHGAALVHCRGGVSRSPSILLAYLCRQGMSLPEAAQLLSGAARTRPNDVFLDAIAEHLGLDSYDRVALVKTLGHW